MPCDSSFGCCAVRAERAAGHVGHVRRELVDDAGQQLVVVEGAPRAAVEPLLPPPVLVAPEVLVVAAEQGQRRVVGEPGDLLPRLGLDLAAQRLLLGVGRAGEQEVLPDEQAELVAQVVEVVGLVDAAAPDPHQVDVGRLRLGQPGGVPGPVDAGRERVVGDPVDSLDQDRAVVDDQLEGGARGIRLGVPAHRAEPDPAGRRVEHLVVGGQLEPHVVERLGAVTGRPPALDGAELGLEGRLVVAGGHQRGCRGAGDVEGDGEVCGFGAKGAGHPHRRPHPAARAVGLGQHPHLVEAGRAPRHQVRRAPDAAGAGGDAPVPTEAAGRLADRLVRHRVGPRPSAEGDALCVRVAHRAAEGDGEVVLAGPQPVGDVDPVAPVLVGDLGHDLAVEQHRRHRVEPVEDQLVALRPREVVRGEHQRALVGPVDEPDPREQGLVVVEVGVGDEAGPEQVEVHDPGHLRRHDGIPQRFGHRARGGAHGPPGAERADHSGATTVWAGASQPARLIRCSSTTAMMPTTTSASSPRT